MAPLRNLRADIVDRIVEAATPGLAPLELEGDVVRRYYRLTAADDLTARSVDDLAGAAVAHLRLGLARRSGEPAIRVHNPVLDQHGWQSRHTVVQVVTEDMPFLVDSVTMALSRHDLGIHLVVHPIIDDVSYVHVEIDRQADPAVLAELTSDLRHVLDDVRAATADWQPMRDAMLAAADELEAAPAGVLDDVAEVQALLRWLADDHFTFIGVRRYDLVDDDGDDLLVPREGTGLGVLRAGSDASTSFAKLPPEVRRRARERRVLNLTKTNAMATVHRPSRLDYVGVKQFDEAGEVIGEKRFLGLFTSSVFTAPVLDVPWVGPKARDVIERAGFDPGSHGEKELLDVLEAYPREVLFQIDVDELFDQAVGMLQLQERRRVRLFVTHDTFGRFVSCLVFIPRDRFNTDTRLAMQSVLLEAYGGSSIDYTMRLSESVLVRLHVVVHLDPTAGAPTPDTAAVEARLAEVTRSWADELHDALVDDVGEPEGVRRQRRWAGAFPAGYREAFAPRLAVGDIARLEQLDEGGAGAADGRVLHLYTPAGRGDDLRLKLYGAGDPPALAEVLPQLGGLGLTVIDERPFDLDLGATPTADPSTRRWIYDFGLRPQGPLRLDDGDDRAAVIDTLTRVWRGEIESDGFNRLVLAAGIGWRDVAVVRAYGRYLRQVAPTFSPAAVEDVVVEHAAITGLIVELFHIRFDPSGTDDDATAEQRTRRGGELVAEVEARLEQVERLDDDRILRRLLALVQATLRTNVHRYPADVAPPAITFKLDPGAIPELPLPRPHVELFVYSPRLEGVHLRAGPVARGGIRWSDRRDDFRTEVLGLMKAQAVKNAVIVPVGAKGGFVVKQLPAGDRAAVLAEVVACYRTFISSLLELTDDIVDGEVVAPSDVVRYDGDDPYLVVAADKGTASFSDIANELSTERHFWLGDAFASGGSAGYDHKAMGITARGAWESVKRHFRNLDIDPGATEVTAVGIGDMSGDVFGNGMLLTPRLRLVAAFDHRHVFFDPDPDPARAIEERRRLFELPGSSWADYDAERISAGGGVFPRTAKSIPLSPEVRRVLGTDTERLTPAEVVRAILAAPVDLLWNGGVGTYVKASDETHAEVGDKANDAVRIDATELRCRVVGEGGNLGFTQRARVEAARRGVRINTDAIDNSAGVDCSDHEVNIKILLDDLVKAGDLTTRQRNDLLAAMTDEVAELVLADNAEQAQALDNSTAQAPGMLDVHARYLRHLEQTGRLDRAVEFLPDDDELAERAQRGEGLTAPELAVVMAYTKNGLQSGLLDTDVPEDPYLGQLMAAYFPSALDDDRSGPGSLGERARRAMGAHPLRREIVATTIANGVVNRAGTTFVFRMGAETGAPVSEIVRAHAAAIELFALEPLWREVRRLGTDVPARRQTAMLLEVRRLAERATRWLLSHRPRPLDVGGTVADFADGAAAVADALDGLVVGDAAVNLQAEVTALEADGVPAPVARNVAGLGELFAALDITAVARAAAEPVDRVARVHHGLDGALELTWLRSRVIALPRETRWQALARSALRDELYATHAALTADVLAVTPRSAVDAGDRIEAWTARGGERVARFRSMLADVHGVATPDLAMLSVVLRELRTLVCAES